MVKKYPKAILLAPRNAVREVLAETDAGVMLQSGSWVRVAGTKPLTKNAAWQRAYRAAREAEGRRQLLAWIPGDAFNALMEAKRPGENTADVITRLIKAFNLL